MSTHLLLDFDGTLADSSPGIFQSFLLGCEALGLTPPVDDVFRRLIGPPIQQIVHKLYPQLSPSDVERFRLTFRDDYDQRGFRYASWYPGVHDVLRTLANVPFLSLSVVTNKPTQPTVELLQSAALLSCFDKIIGIDYRAIASGGSVFSSKAEAIAFALTTASSDSDRQFYVGDTPSDQAAAQACGIDFIAARYGFYNWSDSQDEPLFIDSFPQLIPLLMHGSDPF